MALKCSITRVTSLPSLGRPSHQQGIFKRQLKAEKILRKLQLKNDYLKMRLMSYFSYKFLLQSLHSL